MSTQRLSESQLGEYVDMAYLQNPYHQSHAAERLTKLFGSHNLQGIFGRGKPMRSEVIEHIRKRNPAFTPSPYLMNNPPASDKASIPWSQTGRNKAGQYYDHGLVGRTIHLADPADIREFDPRYLHGTQPSVTSSGVIHYMEKGQAGPLYADRHDVGNDVPFVYVHSGTGQLRLLGGHHRATSALLKGEPLVARFAVGDY